MTELRYCGNFRGAPSSTLRSVIRFGAAAVLGVLIAIGSSETPAMAQTLPGFSEQVVFNGLIEPTVVQFSSDGRVFIAERNGLIKVFDSLADSTPTVFA